ncbi:ferredoxin [Actinocorallia sp. API 0066]|uniref:ferredoxin n=1 Tax=Actinocorallia sp. API 0066 TaxID=2896846 RepID=UPI001E3FF002|nr:ferredoxin [Actinocorallia sp. API 0066]MCD0451605.1 ferredoxin [Actinocorallia sp. API 0066]
MSTVRVEADRESCISAGRCMAANSSVFDQDDDGIVVVRTTHPAPEHRDSVRKAAYLCPAGAITLRSAP